MQEIVFENNRYKISFDAMGDALQKRLSPEELQKYLELLQLVQVKPKAVYRDIKAFCASFTDVPEVINLLTFAHIRNHKIMEAENLIAETYHKHPEYLFARINYADQCVRKKKFGEIVKIFPSFSLKELCPGKEVFHTSEFRGFLTMMGHYQLALKSREKALHYFLAAKEIDPSHPGVLYLEKKLFKKGFWRSVLGLFMRKAEAKSLSSPR